MIKTRSILLATLASAVLTLPVLAQPYGPPPPPPGGYGYGPPHHDFGGPPPGAWDLDHRIQWMQDRIDRGRADGSLDRHEFRRVQGQLNGIRHEEQRIRWHNGGRLDGPGFQDLQDRLDHLNDEVHWLRHNDDHRPW